MVRSSRSSSTSGRAGRCRGSAGPRPPGCSAALARPDRGFSAVVIGEPQRAFYGNQFGLTFPVFVHYGVELWVPEVGGAIDPGSDAHDLVMRLYGGMSKGERKRIKTRVRSAMSRPGGDAGPVPRRPTAVRLRARRRRAAPEPGEGRRREAAPPARARPESAPVVAADLRRVPRRPRLPRHRRAAHGRRDRVAERRRPGPQPPPKGSPGGSRPSERSCRTRATPAARSRRSSGGRRCSSTSRT